MEPMADPGPPSSEPLEPPLGDVLGDVPLLRELQRVLLSSTGPVNWELARQVGIAMASWGTDDPAPGERDRRDLVDVVRMAELAVADFTGLPTPGEVSEVRAVRRAQWVEANITGLRGILEPVAARLARALDDAQTQALPAGMEGSGQFLEALMGRMVPLLLGAQVGTALGRLGQRVFGTFDLAVPRPESAISFVVPNIRAFERDWSLDGREFRAWVALHEVTHRFEFAGRWAAEHFRSLVTDLVEHAELDLSGIQQRMVDVDFDNPDAMAQAFEGVGNLFGTAGDEEQRLRIARVQAFVAAAEGYGDHVVEGIGRTMLSSFGQIGEALKRHRDGGAADRALEELLGLEMQAEHYRQGRAFCERVVELTSEPTLARMWGSAGSLPSMPELAEPSLWLARMA
jgi:coenzyme F420 biosynthesis associated uncharacterized protein